MSKDSYQGIPKRVGVKVDKAGELYTDKVKGGHQQSVAVSGTFTDGYASVSHASIGWNSFAIVSTLSSGTAAVQPQIEVDGEKNLVKISTVSGDDRRFSCLIVNAGIHNSK